MLGGRSEFVLSNAGHVASLVNPPGNPKSSYFTGPSPGPDPNAWRAGARQHTGSWWEYWVTWAGQRSGNKRKAPATLGSEQHPQLVPAPGTYIFG
jgi:polyhydroxyalkanoate synthase